MSKVPYTRPKVSLTVARWLSNGEKVNKSSNAWKSVMGVLDYHGISHNLGRVVYVCLVCRQLGITETEENRNRLIDNFDWACTCDRGSKTVTFRTEEV